MSFLLILKATLFFTFPKELKYQENQCFKKNHPQSIAIKKKRRNILFTEVIFRYNIMTKSFFFPLS